MLSDARETAHLTLNEFLCYVNGYVADFLPERKPVDGKQYQLTTAIANEIRMSGLKKIARGLFKWAIAKYILSPNLVHPDRVSEDLFGSYIYGIFMYLTISLMGDISHGFQEIIYLVPMKVKLF